MKVLVVYESMYGNTHLVADAIGDGLREGHEVEVVSVHDADRALLDGADLVVVGGPTHAHGLPRDTSRESAAAMASKPDSGLVLEPDAEGPGLREWFDSIGTVTGVRGAAFDTRIDMAPILTGRASKGISKRLRHHGFRELVEPESFLVTKDNHLLDDQIEHASTWGKALGTTLATAVPAATDT